MAVSPSTRRVVRERARRRCEYCHADERWQFIRFTIDHVVPQSAGGSDDADNLALACRNCNERRGNRLEGRDPETQTFVPLGAGEREAISLAQDLRAGLLLMDDLDGREAAEHHGTGRASPA